MGILTFSLLGYGFFKGILRFHLYFFMSSLWGATGTILEVFWVPLGSLWEPRGRPFGASGGHFGLTLLVLGSPWPLLGCTFAPNLVTLGATIASEGNFCMLLGAMG